MDTNVKIYYIPDYVTFTWCKTQEEHYHIFLEDYAINAGEKIDDIVEDAGVELYDALKELKDKGMYEGNAGMSGMWYLLTLFEVYSYPSQFGSGHDGLYINLNTDHERTNEKLELLIKLNLENKFKGEKNGR